jgi:Rieske Fe-S protein
MQRRDFIKGTCKFCLLGAAGFAVALEACSPKSGAAVAEKPKSVPAQNNTALIPLSNLGTDKEYHIITVEKYPYEIAVQQRQDNTYKAILLMCTHQDNALTPTGNGYTCNVHGSKFNRDGKVMNGPAEQPLIELKTEIQSTNLLIHLQKLS